MLITVAALISMQAVLAKMALDQCIMAPLFLIVFFFATKTLEGQPHKLLETLREKYLKTVLIGYIIWPLAHIINFKFVPNDLRILYVNVVQVPSFTTPLSFFLPNYTCMSFTAVVHVK